MTEYNKNARITVLVDYYSITSNLLILINKCQVCYISVI